jgi:HEAT repeat protein
MRPILMLALLGSLAVAGNDEAEKAARQEAEALCKRLGDKEAGERLEAARTAASNHHALLTAPLTRLLKDKDARVRFAAISALGLRNDPKAQKKAASALAARLRPLEGKEERTEELTAVIQALHDLAQPSTVKALLDIKSGANPDVARARAMAVANVPSKETIERLIQFGYKDRKGSGQTRKLATAALAYATQTKVRGGVEQWRQWWSDNKDTFDVDAAAEKRASRRIEQKEREAKRKERKKRKPKKKDGA